MRTVFRFFVAVVVTASFAVPTLASAAGTATIPTRALTANGGTVTWPAMVHNAKTCSWSSSPNVAGFATTVKCKSGRVERSFRFAANPSTKAKLYTLSLTVRGAATTVDHLKVVIAGQTAPTTTTTTTTTTTATTTFPRRQLLRRSPRQQHRAARQLRQPRPQRRRRCPFHHPPAGPRPTGRDMSSWEEAAGISR